MFAKPSTLSEVNVGDFEMGTEAVVVGTISPSLKKEKTYSLKVELILLSMGKAILRSTLNAEIPHSMLKGYAHEVSNYRINPLALGLSCSSVWNHIALGPRVQLIKG